MGVAVLSHGAVVRAALVACAGACEAGCGPQGQAGRLTSEAGLWSQIGIWTPPLALSELAQIIETDLAQIIETDLHCISLTEGEVGKCLLHGSLETPCA